MTEKIYVASPLSRELLSVLGFIIANDHNGTPYILGDSLKGYANVTLPEHRSETGTTAEEAAVAHLKARGFVRLRDGVLNGKPVKEVVIADEVFVQGGGNAQPGKLPEVVEALLLQEELVDKLFKRMGNPADDLMHAAVGISGEAGELLDAVKKLWAYGKPLDWANVQEELGDIFFYWLAMLQLSGYSVSQILVNNQAKLLRRYPNGRYSDADANARADKQPVAGVNVDLNNGD